MNALRKKVVETTIAAIIFIALTLYFTYPLVFCAHNSLVNLRDPMLGTFLIGKGVQVLFSDPLNFFDAGTFYPYYDSRAFSEHFFWDTVLAAPIILLTGNFVLAYNLNLLIAFVLSGVGVYLLTDYLTGNYSASIIAGTIFAFCNMRFLHIANLQIQWIAPLPFIVLFLLRFLRQGKINNLLFFTVALTVQVLASLYYAVFSYLLIGALVTILFIMREQGINLKNVSKVFLAMVLVFLITLPFHIPYIYVQIHHQAGVTLEQASKQNTNIISYFTLPRFNKSILTPILNDFFNEWRVGFFPGIIALLLTVAALTKLWRSRCWSTAAPLILWAWRAAITFYIGVVLFGVFASVCPILLGSAASYISDLTLPFIALPILILAGVYFSDTNRIDGGVRDTRKNVVIFGVLALIFFIVSLGARAKAGVVDLGISMYSLLFIILPPLKAIRYVNRFSVLVMFAVAILAGIGAAIILQRFKRKLIRVIITLGCILFMAYEYHATPLFHETVPTEIPEVYEWLSKQEGHFAIMEIPPYKDAPREGIRMYWSLRHDKDLVWGYSGFSPRLQMALSSAVGHLPAPNAVNYIRRVGIKYLLVHGSEPGGRYQKLAGALKRYKRFLKFVGRFEGTAVFENLNYMSGKTEVRIFRTRELEGARISFKAKAPNWDRDLVPSLKVFLDNALVAEFALFKKWRSYSLEVSNLSGFSDLHSLKFAYSYKPKKKIRNTIPGMSEALPADVDLRSVYRQSGMASQLFTHAAVNGLNEKELSSGYTLFSINPKNGEIEKRATFNARTAGSGQKLAEFVGSIPEGRFVVGITCYRSGALLSDAALAALRSLGCAEAEKIKSGKAMSHIFIGRKGAKPGTALEKTGYKEVTMKVGRDQEKLGFIIRDLKIEKDYSTR